MKSIAYVLVLGSLMGCQSASEDVAIGEGAMASAVPSVERESASTASRAGVAKVDAVSRDERQGNCEISVIEPEIEAPTPAATGAIRRALPKASLERICTPEPGAADEPFRHESSFRVTTNVRGILSIEVALSAISEEESHNVSKGYVFDLATGKRLALRDILDARGLAKLIAACAPMVDQTSCEISMTEASGEPAQFTVAEDGISLLVFLETVLVRWEELEGMILPGPIPSYLGR